MSCGAEDYIEAAIFYVAIFSLRIFLIQGNWVGRRLHLSQSHHYDEIKLKHKKRAAV